jgi:hypothetical protein
VGLTLCAILFGAARAIWRRGTVGPNRRGAEGDAALLESLQQATPQAHLEFSVENALTDRNRPPDLRIVELELDLEEPLRTPDLLRGLDQLQSITIRGYLDPRIPLILTDLPRLERVALKGRPPLPLLRVLRVRTLKNLSLRHSEEGDRLVADYLAIAKPDLETLDLGYTGLTAEGIQSLARCPPVPILNLEGNKLATAEVDALLALYREWKRYGRKGSFKLKVKHSNELSDEDLGRLESSGLVEVVYNRGK